MKKIPLTRGKYALVDNEDFEYLNQWKWYCNSGRACRTVSLPGDCAKKRNRKVVYMHRLIMNDPKNMEVDHINSDPLDNRKSNLRICKMSDNKKNRLLNKNNKSGYKGVSWNERLGKWVVVVQNKHIGCFLDKELAARKYNEVALSLFGEFAKLNEVRNK